MCMTLRFFSCGNTTAVVTWLQWIKKALLIPNKSVQRLMLYKKNEIRFHWLDHFCLCLVLSFCCSSLVVDVFIVVNIVTNVAMSLLSTTLVVVFCRLHYLWRRFCRHWLFCYRLYYYDVVFVVIINCQCSYCRLHLFRRSYFVFVLLLLWTTTIFMYIHIWIFTKQMVRKLFMVKEIFFYFILMERGLFFY